MTPRTNLAETKRSVPETVRALKYKEYDMGDREKDAPLQTNQHAFDSLRTFHSMLAKRELFSVK